MSDNSKKAAALIVYVVGAFLTFGHVFNMNYVEPKADCGAKPDILENRTAWDDWYWCEHPRASGTTFGAFWPAFVAGLEWPIYWAGHFAIKVTK